MNITKAQYFTSPISGEKKSIIITVGEQEMFVPLDSANRHYAAILEWAEKDGNEIQAAE